jgi:hypothetical protein
MFLRTAQVPSPENHTRRTDRTGGLTQTGASIACLFDNLEKYSYSYGRLRKTVIPSSKMQHSKKIRVRSLEVSDFGFIRRLAAKPHNFTCPPPYVLWLLKKAHSESCLVAEHAKLGPVAYLLSLPVKTSYGKALYVWQFATSADGLRTGATNVLLLALRTLVHRMRVHALFFTAVPDSPEFRAIRRYAYALSGHTPLPRENLPDTVCRNEREYVIKVR